MNKKALLVILDGWGIGNNGKGDVIYNTPTPYWDYLVSNYPHSELQASGENVGLPAGQMGNSEVGHLNIGGGRVVYQDLLKINRAIADGSIRQNPELVSAVEYAKNNGKKLHFMGLTSDGGVHSSLEHLEAMYKMAVDEGVKDVYVHCFMDGRDTDPKSGAGFIKQLSDKGMNLATIVGRYYAMDRDKRWERVKIAYDLLVNGEGKSLNITSIAILAVAFFFTNPATVLTKYVQEEQNSINNVTQHYANSQDRGVIHDKESTKKLKEKLQKESSKTTKELYPVDGYRYNHPDQSEYNH